MSMYFQNVQTGQDFSCRQPSFTKELKDTHTLSSRKETQAAPLPPHLSISATTFG